MFAELMSCGVNAFYWLHLQSKSALVLCESKEKQDDVFI